MLCNFGFFRCRSRPWPLFSGFEFLGVIWSRRSLRHLRSVDLDNVESGKRPATNIRTTRVLTATASSPDRLPDGQPLHQRGL